jgi:tRNA nucleotidyltransferase/poly(A) polymerase
MPVSKEIIASTLATPHGERAYKVTERLFDAGYDTWWVGGCVRDMIGGTVPQDIDIATEALPQDVLKLFTRSDAAPSLFGSVRILMGDSTFEVTTFREDDSASDGRHPESVIFGKRELDAKRRDFTINAIYFHPISQEIYDPFHGQEDLKERLIRFIGEPETRIRHDALRLLRAVRFRARIDGQYHPDTYRALQRLADSVKILSGGRQLQELEKMLHSPHPDRALEDLLELSILQHFLPELSDCKGIPQPSDYHHEGDVWVHTMQCLASLRDEDDANVRLAILFHDCGKAKTFSLKEHIRFDEHASVSAKLTETALTRLQCPRKRTDIICWLIAHHMMMATFEKIGDERKAHWYFHPWFRDLLRVFELDIAGTDPQNYSLFEEILKDYHRFLDRHPRPERPLLTGDEIMAILGIKPGAEVGKLLKELHDAQIKGDVTTRRDARAFLRRHPNLPRERSGGTRHE